MQDLDDIIVCDLYFSLFRAFSVYEDCLVVQVYVACFQSTQLGDSHACGKQKFGYGDVAEGIFPLVVCLGFGMASVHGGEKCFDGVQRNGLGQYDRLAEPYLYFVEWIPVDDVFIFKIMEKGF